MAPVSFSDIAKPANDLLNKDFYHTASANLEVKSKAPNGVQFTVKGQSDHKQGAITGCIEGKYTDKPLGLTITQAWTTLNSLDSKIELDNTLANGLKAEVFYKYLPVAQSKSINLNLHYKQPFFHTRAFFDLLRGHSFIGDAVIGHDGFLAGAEVGYDVSDGRITRYSAAVGYSVPQYTAAITAANNLSVFSESYYHKVNSLVEGGAKASWDAKSATHPSLEFAAKYKLDSNAFVKVKINDRGIVALAYNQLLRPGVTLGLGASIDSQRPNEPAHKVGLSLTLEG